MTESDSVTPSEPAVEEMPVAEQAEAAQPEPISPPDKAKKKKLLIMIVAIVVVAALVASAAYMVVFAGKKLSVTMDPEEIPAIPAGGAQALSVEVKWGNSVVDADDGVKYSWSVTPDSLGGFNYEARASVIFEAGNSGGDGTVACEVTYEGKTSTVEADVVVEPPFLDTVNIAPSTKTLYPGAESDFTATAVNSVGQTVDGATFSWAVTGADAGDYTLSSTTGATVTFSCSVEAEVTLTATATSGGETASGTATVIVTYDVAVRSVDTSWYDFFNHPLGPWYEDRMINYGDEWAITDEYPYLYIWAGEPIGNTWIYSLARMNISALNLDTSEMSMNERPVFLPYLSGDDGARGGNAVLDWYMNYATYDECAAKLGSQALSYYDGWYVELNGTITLDRQAAKAVLGVTDSQFDDLDTWWGLNGDDVKVGFQEWYELMSGPELYPEYDIFAGYDYYLDFVYFVLEVEEVGDEEVVLWLDTISWGGEAMVYKFLYHSFLPTEWYMEDMDLHATIGPERSDVYLDTAVGYATYAYEAIEPLGMACWAWEPLMQDYVESTYKNPYSLYDAYADFEYYNLAPGSVWYEKNMTWDYTPLAWNLSANETLKLQWPDTEMIFFVHDEESATDPMESDTLEILVDRVRVFEANVTCDYLEPGPSDFEDQIFLDYDNQTVEYVGPIDFWTWSKEQEIYEELAEQWDDLEILPYGIPWVEFRADLDEPVPELVIQDVPSVAEIGEPFSFNVTIRDAATGDPMTDYRGTVTFVSSDLAAVLPADYEFVAGDAGRHEFAATFNTVDAETHDATHYLTAADTVDESLADTVDEILVIESPRLDAFDVAFDDDTVIALESTDVTVTALNQWGETLTDYDGTVNFTSSDDDATLPPNTTYDPADEGVMTFSVVYVTEGLQTLTATDVDNTDATGEDSINVLAARAADHYVLSGLAVDVGTNVTITVNVTIEDQYNDPFMAYGGTMEVNSNNSDDFTEPADATFTPGDPWVEVDVEFTAEGTFMVYFNDTVDSFITASMEVDAWDDQPVADHFEVTGITDMWENDVSDVTVTCINQYDSVFEAYDGTIVFSTNAPSGATLPTTDLTFDPVSDKGIKTYVDGVSFDEPSDPGWFNVTVTDSVDPTVKGSQEDIFIEDLVATTLELTSTVSEVTENITFSLTVTVYHQHDLAFEEYDGTVDFTSTDDSGYAVLPSSYEFQPSDAGTRDFAGVSLSKHGLQTVTADDGSLSDTVDIQVNELITAKLDYRIYDMFGEKWGPWWTVREDSAWDTDRALTNGAGNMTYLYDAFDDYDVGIIYTPYRWNIQGTELPNLDVHNPMFCFVNGTSGPQAEAMATVEIYHQYLTPEAWDDIWIPMWNSNWAWEAAFVDLMGGDDGWFSGAFINITMNREAALEWLDMPTDATPADWWSDNRDDYRAEWFDWLNEQGNVIYDIFAGYDYPYEDMLGAGPLMELEGDADEVTVRMGTITWGYEALLTRWLNASGLSVHQPYMEDLSLTLEYTGSEVNVSFDAVCQWSMKCVRQNETAPTVGAPCAWAWTPAHLDYLIPKQAGHPSAYAPYDYDSTGMTYESLNCGDPHYGTESRHEYTPVQFTLPEYGRLIIELPDDPVPGFYAQPMPTDAVENVFRWNDMSDYTDLDYEGVITFGFCDELDDAASYEYTQTGNKTMFIQGPWAPENPHPADPNLMLTGAPWIEFNVTIPTMGASSSVIPSAIPLEEPVPTTTPQTSAAATSATMEIASLLAVVSAVMMLIAALAVGAGRRYDQ